MHALKSPLKYFLKSFIFLKYFFLYFPFAIKRKRRDVMSVSSCNSVNSVIMYNMEIMIKMPFVITLISTAVMIIVFN